MSTYPGKESVCTAVGRIMSRTTVTLQSATESLLHLSTLQPVSLYSWTYMSDSPPMLEEKGKCSCTSLVLEMRNPCPVVYHIELLSRHSDSCQLPTLRFSRPQLLRIWACAVIRTPAEKWRHSPSVTSGEQDTGCASEIDALLQSSASYLCKATIRRRFIIYYREKAGEPTYATLFPGMNLTVCSRR